MRTSAKTGEGKNEPHDDLKLQRSISLSFMIVNKDSRYWIAGGTKENNKAITMCVAALI